MFFRLRSFEFAIDDQNGGSSNEGRNEVDGVIVLVKSMASDGHPLKWVNDIRKKPDLSSQTMLTTPHLIGDVKMARSIQSLDDSVYRV